MLNEIGDDDDDDELEDEDMSLVEDDVTYD